MKFVPLQDMGKPPAGKVPFHRAGLCVDGDLILTILGVKVRRGVILIVHRNDNSQKSRKFRHALKLPGFPESINGITVSISGAGQPPRSPEIRVT